MLHPELATQSPRAAVHEEARLVEAVGLAEAIGLSVVGTEARRVNTARPATLLGRGAVDEIGARLASLDADLVVVDHALSPVQQRNLEKAWKTKVIDRTGLILEIFGARARTKEGKLQVELAHLSYQRSRLVRSWTHLERQRGGGGFMGGPGESQIELDRRQLDERIVAIRRQLEQVRRTRGLHREARARVPYPTAALVGYTNAGKSTLFNRLTGATVEARDQVFATLDPTMRQVTLPSGRRVILSDTVGFISDLPTDLVAAFRATLEEVTEANLVLHVRDIADPDSEAQRTEVNAVLASLGLDENAGEGPIEVWNKADLLPAEDVEILRARLARDNRARGPVLVSALTGDGCDALLAAVDDHLAREDEVLDVSVPSREGRWLAWLHENGEVLERRDADSDVRVTVRLTPADRARLEAAGIEGLAVRPRP